MNPNITHQTAAERLAMRPPQRPWTGVQSPAPAPIRQNQGDQKPRFVAKGHDAQLQDAQMGRHDTEVISQSGIIYNGTIVRRDKYTITLLCPAGELILYKHAIESIQITKPVKAA